MARRFLATGVIAGFINQLAVSADGSALSVSVATGDAFVEGFMYRNDTALAQPIATANATNPRIDTVVVRLDRTANTALLAVVTGTPAASPVAPTLSQTDILFEFPLANVLVPAAAGVIVAGNVTDRRVFTKNLTEAAASAAYAPVSTTPRGVKGLATVTVDQSGIVTTTDLVGLSVTFTAEAGRRYAARFHGNFETTIGGDTTAVILAVGAATGGYGQIRLSASGVQETLPVLALAAPAAGPLTIKVQAGRAAGTGSTTLKASSTNPAYLLVQDIGAV